MGTISEKLTYLNDTKGLLKDSINSLGGEITSQTTFRQYATELDSIYASLPKVSGTGSNISLSPTRKGRITSQINGDTFQQTYTGKNLFDINGNLMSSASGLTNTYNSDGSVTTTGVANSSYARITYAIEIDNRLEDGQQYTISQKEANSNLYIQVTATNKSTSAKTYYSCGSVTSRTFTADLTNYTYVLQVQTGTTSSWGSSSRTITNYYMLEKNSSSTDFEPFVGRIPSPNPSYPQNIESVTGLQTITVSDGTNTQTKQLNLGNIKLKKSQDGTYQDYITGSPNNWSIKRQIGSVVLDGSENWQYYNGVQYITSITDYKLSGLICICDYFQAQENVTQSGDVQDKHITFRNAVGNPIFYIKDTTYSDSATFKTWLSTHNTKVDYVLATETTEPITNTELIEDLNNLYYAKSYNGTTNISVEGDLPMILSVSALKGE